MNFHEYLLKHVVAACRRHTASRQLAVHRRLIGLHQFTEGFLLATAVTRQPVALVEADNHLHGLGFKAHAFCSADVHSLVVHGRDEKVSAAHRVRRGILGRRPCMYRFMGNGNGFGSRVGLFPVL